MTPDATQRILRGFLLLAVVFITAVLGYRFFLGMDWLEATWMAANSITNTGNELSGGSSSFQWFTIFVVAVGFFATLYAFTGLVQLLLAGELDRLLGRRRMEREIGRLRRHVIVCGYGRLGNNLVSDLAHEDEDVVVIEADEQHAQQAVLDGCLVVDGDATEEEVLERAGIREARSLVTTLPSDAANVFIALTARGFNSSLQIIARAESPSTLRKLTQAGANEVVMPATTGAKQMVRMITRPSTAHLFDLLSERTFQDFEMDELAISEKSPLIGHTVAQSQMNYKHKLLIVAVKQKDGQMVFNPGGAYEFQTGDTAIVMGKRGDIQGFCRVHHLPSFAEDGIDHY
jgi:voltage-gated potassium channel